ncbi:hypothetical protein [Novosphingobium lindaniclasticum]|nr:hypothetical protein [Novosphingobium lindaniclasticum]
MSYTEDDIMHENGAFWVLRERNRKRGRFDFFTYENVGTHSVRRGTFALADEADSLRRAIKDCDSRAFTAADDAWGAELVKAYGKAACNARYDARGTATDRLKSLYRVREEAGRACGLLADVTSRYAA